MPPKFEKPKFSKETKERTPRETLKERFTDIISVHVDADNVDSFSEKALNQLILFMHAVTLEYKKEVQSEDDGITKELEDIALAHYELPAIEEYFSEIESRQKTVVEAQELIAALRPEPVIITPSDERRVIPNNGDGEFEAPLTHKRLVLLFYLLKVDFDISLQSADIQKGVVTDEMMRKESYIAVTIREKDRVVYVCDEIGNATFIFDTNKFAEIQLSVEKLNLLTKNEKNALIAENPGIGIRIGYSKYYRENIARLLDGAIPSSQTFKESTQTKPELQQNTVELPKVITDELHPWRGFLEMKDEEGVVKHWGAVKTIAQRLNTDNRKVIEAIDGLLPKEGKDVTGRKSNLYSFEQIQEKLKNFLNLPKVDPDGERKGFFKQTNKETGVVVHYGTAETIARELNLSPGKIMASLSALSSLEGRDMAGREAKLYSLEQIKSILKEYLILPQVETKGEWKGFFVQTSEKDTETGVTEHYGALGTIAQRLNIDNRKVVEAIDGLLPKEGKIIGGREFPLYSLEQIKGKLKEYLNLPQVALEGEWKGFSEQTHEKTHATEHYGSSEIIAQRLDLSWGKIESSVEGISSLKGRNTRGREVDLYSLEQIKEKLKEYLNLPQVALEGEWKGFSEQTNEKGIVEHYGTVGTISKNLNLSTGKIESSLEGITSVNGRDVMGREADLYSLEQIARKLEK